MPRSPTIAGDTGSPLDAEHPWPGLESFWEQDRHFFRGRDAQIRELLNLIRRSRLAVLYGRSGLGKSSLLRAGVFPRLREERFLPVDLRINFDNASPPPEQQIFQALEEAAAKTGIEAPRLRAGDSLWMHLHRNASIYWGEDNRPVVPVLVFDQFEEAFTLGRDPAANTRSDDLLNSLAWLAQGWIPEPLREAFELDALSPSDFSLTGHRYKIVLSLREDYLGVFKTLRPRIPSLEANMMRLEPMTGDAGLLVTQAGGSTLVPQDVGITIVRLVGEASESADLGDIVIDPPLLSLVLRELNERRKVEGGQVIESADVGERDRILTDFYEKSLRDLSSDVRGFVESRLLTRRGAYRTKVDVDDALVEDGIVESDIEKLVTRRLLRVDDTAGRPQIELTHDVLTGVVRRSRDQRIELQRAAEEKLQAEQARREAQREREEARLREELNARELRNIKLEEEKVRSERARHAYREKMARRMRALILALAATLVLVAVLSFRVVLSARAAEIALRDYILADSTRQEAIRASLALGDGTRQLTPDDSVRAATVRDTLAGSGPGTTGYRKVWPPGTTLRIGFLGGSTEVRTLVQEYALTWTRYANLRFDFCTACDAQIRIGFERGGGSWSYLGPDALGVPPTEPTMNFGWLDARTPAREARAVVLHEFGHVLGMVEEHTNPNANIPWDTAAVYRYFEGAPNFWTRDQIRGTLFERAEGSYRAFDPHSIMMNALDSALTAGRLSVGINSELSEADKAFAAQLYPRSGTSPPDTAIRPDTTLFAPDTTGRQTVVPSASTSTKESGMFGSNILDVAIGLVLVFLLLSLIASGIREAVEAFVRSRAVDLERGIRSLLNDEDGNGLTKQFYEHPMIRSLYRHKYVPRGKRFRGRNLPTYIPARNFAVAMIDMALRGPATGPYATSQTAPMLSVEGLRSSVQRIPDPFVQRAVLSAIDNARGEITEVRKNLEAWYDSAMDRVAGHYKRRAQFWLFVIGLGIAGALNVNTLTIADYLARDDQARAALVSRATEILADSSYRELVGDSAVTLAATRAVYEDLQSLNLPIGWDRKLPRPAQSGWLGYMFRQLAGILMTAFAIMLGAPFWFDLLNKFMVIRSTVKPHEKSPEEASEDRQSKDAGTVEDIANAQMASVAALAPGARASESRGGAGAADQAREIHMPEPPHTDHEWASGEPGEGIL